MLDSAMLDILSNVEPAGEPEISLGFPLDAGNFSDDDGPTVAPPAPAPPQEAVLAVFTELLQLILRRDLESRIRIRVDCRRATRATLEAEGVSLFALLSKAYVLTEWIPAPDLLWRAIWELFPEVDHKIKPGDKPHLVKVSFTASASSLAEKLLHASPQLRAAVGVASGDTAATVASDTVDRTAIFARFTTPVRAAALPLLRRHACVLSDACLLRASQKPKPAKRPRKAAAATPSRAAAPAQAFPSAPSTPVAGAARFALPMAPLGEQEECVGGLVVSPVPIDEPLRSAFSTPAPRLALAPRAPPPAPRAPSRDDFLGSVSLLARYAQEMAGQQENCGHFLEVLERGSEEIALTLQPLAALANGAVVAPPTLRLLGFLAGQTPEGCVAAPSPHAAHGGSSPSFLFLFW